MALDLDNKPGQVYNPDNSGPDGSHDKGAIFPGEQAQFDQIEAGERDLAELEKNATSTDGNSTATSDAEAALSGTPKDEEHKIRVNLADKSDSSKKKKKIVGGVVVGVTLSAAGVVMLLPQILMKTITDKLADTFIGRAQYAVQQRAEVYVTRYVNDVIGGTMRTCPGTKISKDCVAISPDRKTLWGTFATNWRENRIEEKLFKNQGIEFRLDTNDPNKINVLKNGESLGDFGRRSVSREVIKAVEAETKFDGILTRRHIRSVLSSKYGANKWCFIACSKRDEFDDLKINGVKKIKLKMIARVSEISSARTTAYLLCLTTGCSQEELDRNDNKLVKEILEKSEAELVESLAKDIEKYGTNDLTQLITRKIVDKIVTAAISKEASQKALSAIPVVGQIYLGATIAELLTNVDGKIKSGEISEFMRKVNIQETALFTTQIATMTDDTQSMKAPITDNWAAFQYMNGFAKSRVWQGMNGIENKTTVECDDGVVLSKPDDPLTCPEFKVQPTLGIEEFRNNETVDTVASILNPYDSCLGGIPDPTGLCPTPRDFIKPVLDIINATLGAVSGAIVSGLELIPGIGDAIDAFKKFVADYAIKFFEWTAKKLLPRLVNPDAEDEVAFDQAAVGYDVLGNTFGKGEPETPDASGIGGSVLSGTQQASLDYAIANQKREDMQRESFFARYFDFDNPDSLVSTATLDTATLFMGGSTQMFDQAQPSNFLSTIASVFGVETRAYAFTTQDRADLFGITQYGYSLDDPNLSVDPLTLTPEQCAVYAKARLDSAFVNEETGETDYTVTNPCALDSIVADTLTKVYDLDAEGGASNPTTSTVTATGLNGYAIPCTGLPNTPEIRGARGDNMNWDGIPDSGTIGMTSGSNPKPIKVYIREACVQTDVKTVVIGSSIHASENYGQPVSFELLFKKDLPENMRVIAIPEINGSKMAPNQVGRVNSNGVNLNRNFNYRWSEMSGDELDSTSTNWRGSSPASEPETQALVSFMNSISSSVSLFLVYHDNLNYVASSNNTDASYARKYHSYLLQGGETIGLGKNGIINIPQMGSLDGWFNNTSGKPTLLLEMPSNVSAAGIGAHADAIIKMVSNGDI